MVVNLDPANEQVFDADIDIIKWVSVRKFMEQQSLGPNGGMILLDRLINV